MSVEALVHASIDEAVSRNISNFIWTISKVRPVLTLSCVPKRPLAKVRSESVSVLEEVLCERAV